MIIIHQHFIVYCLPMACLSMFIKETVSEDFQEKVFFMNQFLLCCWCQQPQQPIVAGDNDNFLQFVACVNDNGDYTVNKSCQHLQ
jgi:hypothetical protein